MDKLSTLQDNELLALLKEGSQQAFRELYIRHKDQLLYSCKKYLKNETMTEDIVQDIFTQLWETHDSLHITTSFSGYLYTSARNRILNIYRQYDVHSRFARYIRDNEQEMTNETEDSIVEKDYADMLNELIDSLPPMQKDVFRLNRIDGLTNKEISEKLNISVENVRKHTSLALKKIKTQLSKHSDIHFQELIIFLLFFS
jgi:RNA polymerase sigma-70 factor (ECF subfamily)